MGVGKKFTLCAKQERHCALCNVSEQALEKYPPQFTELWVLAIFYFFFAAALLSVQLLSPCSFQFVPQRVVLQPSVTPELRMLLSDFYATSFFLLSIRRGGSWLNDSLQLPSGFTALVRNPLKLEEHFSLVLNKQ